MVLTERAAQRLDVKTEQVRDQGGQRVVPYASIIYDPNGKTWVYTSTAPRTFVREKSRSTASQVIRCFSRAGPNAGTMIASRAVAEIYGTELKVGH